MKLTSVLASSALLFLDIMASPISVPGATKSSVASNETNFQSDSSTDISMEGESFCFHETQSSRCLGGTFKKCVKERNGSFDKTVPSFCGFWCTKMNKIEDCGFNKEKFNYNPKWSCKDAKFDC
ncbi:putative secreted protein [Wickerhamomyces ciferrii]|uniref:Secreted protein n=1 Tax=Wickerhamomyces ciferrii (strain ATCC 14091 / BCRC 22168 / CBS 111 / JCM 3599 / NBRC 0793 / NRRL Y-1031 F-60-10) TaxID=1206466 RepID=K0KMM2_WICCF|nr:uncharacterized protein BN7_6123 [Wickerhamomyces ciferrii]CCH46530.1 putative secreted protein [Wickerhamomyces ciferrii]